MCFALPRRVLAAGGPMGEGAGVDGWRRSGVLVGSCEGSDDELEDVAGSGKL